MVKGILVLFLFFFFFAGTFSAVIEGIAVGNGCNAEVECLDASTGNPFNGCSPETINNASFDLVYLISGNCTATQETLNAQKYKGETLNVNKVILSISAAGILNNKEGEDLTFDESIDEVWLKDSAKVLASNGAGILFDSNVTVSGGDVICGDKCYFMGEEIIASGKKGDKGAKGGRPGGNGGTGGNITFKKKLTVSKDSLLTVASIGGTGGEGGDGSDAGNWAFCSGTATPGGTGGTGGNGGKVTVSWLEVKEGAGNVLIASRGGAGGRGGKNGNPCGGFLGGYHTCYPGDGGMGGNAGEVLIEGLSNASAATNIASVPGTEGKGGWQSTTNSNCDVVVTAQNGLPGSNSDVKVTNITGLAPQTIQAKNLVLSTAWSDELESFGDLGFAGFSYWTVSETVSIMACWAKGAEVELVEANALNLLVAKPLAFLSGHIVYGKGINPVVSSDSNPLCLKSVKSEFRLPFFGLIKDKEGVPVNGRAKLRVFSLLGKEKTEENKVKWVNVRKGLINKKVNVTLFMNQFYLMRVDIEANGKTSSFSFPFYTWGVFN